MKTIQITLLDAVHHQAKALALADRRTLKQFFSDAITAHVAMVASLPTVTPSPKGGTQ